MDFLAISATPFATSLLSVGAGIGLSVIASYSRKFANSRMLAKVKHKYPVLDLVVKIAADQAEGTPYGLLVQAAEMIWKGEGVPTSKVQRLAETMANNFSPEKYAGTKWAQMNAADVQQGKAIASTFGFNVD